MVVVFVVVVVVVFRCIGDRTFLSRCHKRLAFQPALSVCDWAYNVDCVDGHRPSTERGTTKLPSTTTTKTTTATTKSVTATTAEPQPYGKLLFAHAELQFKMQSGTIAKVKLCLPVSLSPYPIAVTAALV